MAKATLEERFWAKVDKKGPTSPARPDLGPCWIWTGTRHGKGYGHFSINRQIRKAHRLAYEWLVGPIPQGLTLDHLCQVTSCVRPSHLEPVASGVNTLRGMRNPTAINARKTHCPQGHPYIPENIYWMKKGRNRRCKICQSEAGRRRRTRGASSIR